ncbi:hypothetical protein Z517_10231 [Fonsecaea pedrosoi CBS 271.37]|uniref:Unplaced genomic scaffold supercont1.7, whole genome shotgun sequence n=1 Tax=Fonsecaea pedrosoi CBS 271.37 TaxID=1442368 RepID=A0A0D2G9M7_9EURO|nr:uncharacterized protein Z517_10231 [Fonsecaea pedrosoi CBS 271.37]KIW75490.1 hypothetical protein Z517_10231 [Fonsecaea pedrosoi CBS 271.37]
MAEENRFTPQADFNLLHHAFRTAADEIEKLPNLPAIAGGERILAEIQQMRNETREQFARLEERITASHHSLLTVLSTSDLNNAARVQNTYLSGPSDQLSPFLNPLTGAFIPTFPTTPVEIRRMTVHDVDTTLQQLGLQAGPAGTSLAMKKRRLRVHISLRS